MIEHFKETYIHKSVSFKELPSDLQSSIIQRIIFGTFLDILILSLGICSKNLSTFLLAVLFILVLAIGCLIPYYLATRNLLIQITGICVDKDVYHFLNNKTYQIHLDSMSNQVRVNVKRGIYTNIRNDMEVTVYVVPKNIRQNANGLYTIETPLFVTLKSPQNKG